MLKRQNSPAAMRIRLVFGLSMTLSLANCASEPFAEENAAKRTAVLVGAAQSPTDPAGFVREQRRTDPIDFIPVGVTPPKRDITPRTAAQARALEAELDAARERSRGFASRPQPRPTYDGSIPPRPKPVPPELLPQ
jgi:hypothetical protein